MRIELKCYCPEIEPYGGVNTIEIPEGSTVLKVLTENLKIDWKNIDNNERAQYMVIVNNTIESINTILHDGDQVKVIKSLAGG